MRWRGTLVVVVLALSAAAPLRADVPQAAAAIDACVKQASADLKGLEALRDPCPALAQALRDLKLDPFLPAGWQQRITTRQLAGLNALAARYAQPAPLRALADPARLKDIARSLPHPVSTVSSWDVLKRWVWSWLAARWRALTRFFPTWHATPGQVAVLLYGLIALVVAGAVTVVVIELRAAGVFGARPYRRPRQRRPGPPPAAVAQTLDAAAIAAAAPHLRPVLLLRSLVAALTRSRRLDRERDLTCRELITAARFDTSTQRELFGRVSLLAERALYGDPGCPAPLMSEETLAEASGLTGQLLARPHTRPASP
jgi:hypothetical protein